MARVDPDERAALTGHHRPIVLLERHRGAGPDRFRVADEVAPGNPDLGVMLAYTPVHHLLLGLPGDPPGARVLVMTSGNLAGEPIVTDDDEARDRLAPLADAWLTHDRAIHVPCDDSVVRVVDGVALPVRRSRGYAPMPVHLPFRASPVLAVGGDLKNTFSLAEGHRAWMSAHVGDMDDYRTQQTFGRAERHLEELTGVRPEAVVADLHPGYRTHRWATDHAVGRPVTLVQHHHAHVAATMADAGHDGSRRVLGVAFDGTGYGDDGAVWGGEFLLADYAGYERVAHLGYVALPGGDAGVRNPCRMALSHLRSAGIAWSREHASVRACSDEELRLLDHQLERGFGTAPTSSMGRLFDAVASLVGVCHRVGYEAQAAIELEGLARSAPASAGAYSFGAPDEAGSVDCAPLLQAIVADLRSGTDPARVAARFHGAVVALVTDTAVRVCAATRRRGGHPVGGRVRQHPAGLRLPPLAHRRGPDRAPAPHGPPDGRRPRPGPGRRPQPSFPRRERHCPRGGPAAGDGALMCLAVPGRVLATWDKDGTPMATVDFGGVTKEVCLAYVPDTVVGDYAIVHVGFALQRLDEESALETLALFRQMGELDAEFGDHWGRAADQAGLPRPDGTDGTGPGTTEQEVTR